MHPLRLPITHVTNRHHLSPHVSRLWASDVTTNMRKLPICPYAPPVLLVLELAVLCSSHDGTSLT